MACGATLGLKRRFDQFDSAHGGAPSSSELGGCEPRGPKRRRCIPPTVSRLAAPTKQHQMHVSPFLKAVPRMTTDQIAAELSSQFKRLQPRRHAFNSPPHAFNSPPHTSASSSASCLPPVPFPSSSISDLHGNAADRGAPLTSGGASMVTGGACGGSFATGATPQQRRKDGPLFTLKQVSLVCERMMKEKEEQLREEYEKELSNKLSEQYDAFLKFNQDMLHRRFGESAASYVS